MSAPATRGLRPVYRDQLEGARVPCELCGCPLLLVDVVYVDPEEPDRRTWWEGRTPWREHTPQNCRDERATR